MKSEILALGTVSALMALATTASADVVYSSISNVSIPLNNSQMDFDLNSDGTNDFSLFGNSSVLDLFNSEPDNHMSFADDSGQARIYSVSDTILPADPNVTSTSVTNLIGLGIGYVGFNFTFDAESHTGWMEFNLPTSDSADWVLVAAAWESNPDTSITIAPVPEPSTTALMLLSGLAGFILLRRTKSNVAIRR